MKFFVKPPLDLYVAGDSTYWGKYKTYSEYNYFGGPRLAAYLRIIRFDVALKLTRNYFHRCNVIDFGCADGVFLPSLCKYFNHVAGIDSSRKFMGVSQKVIEALGVDNVQLICNDNLTIDGIKAKLSGRQYQIMYLLGVMEHVGNKSAMYDSKLSFLKEIATLIERDGLIVILVPKMVGLTFLLQRVGLALFGLHREPLSMKNLLKLSFLRDSTEAEKLWDGGHLGFNQDIFKNHLRKDFNILKERDLIFQVMYVVSPRV